MNLKYCALKFKQNKLELLVEKAMLSCRCTRNVTKHTCAHKKRSDSFCIKIFYKKSVAIQNEVFS